MNSSTNHVLPFSQVFFLVFHSCKRDKWAPGLHEIFFLSQMRNIILWLCPCCVPSGKLASFTWEQSSKQYLKPWIWAKNNYSSMLCTATVRVCQHLSVKSVDQILVTSLRRSMLLSSMEWHLWILYPWLPWSEIKELCSDSDFRAYYSFWN